MYKWRKHNQVKRKNEENVYVLVQFILKPSFAMTTSMLHVNIFV